MVFWFFGLVPPPQKKDIHNNNLPGPAFIINAGGTTPKHLTKAILLKHQGFRKIGFFGFLVWFRPSENTNYLSVIIFIRGENNNVMEYVRAQTFCRKPMMHVRAQTSTTRLNSKVARPSPKTRRQPTSTHRSTMSKKPKEKGRLWEGG